MCGDVVCRGGSVGGGCGDGDVGCGNGGAVVGVGGGGATFASPSSKSLTRGQRRSP